MNHSTKT